MPKPKKTRRKSYRNIHECMEDLLSREDLRRINQLGLWSAFSQVDGVRKFAALSRLQRREFFDQYEGSLGDEEPRPASDSDHSLFGLPSDASAQEINRRYRELALAFHPDRPDGDNELMLEINAAYQRLLQQAGADDRGEDPPPPG